MSNYIICTRNIQSSNGAKYFGDKPGSTSFLVLSEEATDLSPSDAAKDANKWLTTLLSGRNLKDILIYVHGFNMTTEETVARHKTLKEGLQKSGWEGELVTFAWPSGHSALVYLEDRHDAKKTALELVNSGIKLLAHQQGNDCTINVHLLGHSTGAFVIYEAFADADTTKETAEINWTVSQILLISGDVSSDSMSENRGVSVYRHVNRLTNYFNPYDAILSISNVKRVGVKNRVGRVGLPDDAPSKGVDINCGNYYNSEKDSITVLNGAHSHSWYFYSDTWFKDATETLQGELDRNVMTTRQKEANGKFDLKKE